MRLSRLLLLLALAAGCYRDAAPSPAPRPVRPATEEARPAPAYSYGPTRTPSRGPMAEALVQLGLFADEMCACADKPCADAVQQMMMTWSTEMAAAHTSSDEKPSDEEMAEATQMVQRLSGCMMTAMGHTAPSTTPTP